MKNYLYSFGLIGLMLFTLVGCVTIGEPSPQDISKALGIVEVKQNDSQEVTVYTGGFSFQGTSVILQQIPDIPTPYFVSMKITYPLSGSQWLTFMMSKGAFGIYKDSFFSTRIKKYERPSKQYSVPKEIGLAETNELALYNNGIKAYFMINDWIVADIELKDLMDTGIGVMIVAHESAGQKLPVTYSNYITRTGEDAINSFDVVRKIYEDRVKELNKKHTADVTASNVAKEDKPRTIDDDVAMKMALGDFFEYIK